ncbi:MAG: response regulator [Chloroflexi bacterium]|nr:response regulator [Chloroflexota bacterium]
MDPAPKPPAILVIDDETGICQAVQRALVSTGYRVDATTSGAEGLRMIQANGYDLALLDVMMPDVGGIDLIASIHEHDPQLVCIIITGYATVELAVRAIKQGAYDFLTKPFSVDDLTLAVEQGLERRRLSLSARRAAAAEAEARRLAAEKKQLVQLDHAKAQFVRLVTHELKAPVAAIASNLKLIQEGYGTPEQQKDLVARSLGRAAEQMELINDLLELGKVQAIEASARNETASLSEALQESLKALSEQVAQKGLKFDVSITGSPPPVTGVPEGLRSLWGNLLGNAVKYTPPGGRIAVRLYAEGGQVIGEVSDSGIGIPAGEQERLFGEFFRASNARQAGIPGSGLGLVIVRRVVENAGGQVGFTSVEGRGTTFRFTIPIPQA